MPEIVISEFMDEAAIREAFAGRDVLYDPQLVDDAARLLDAVRDARALIVRNRTQVRGSLLDAAVKLEVVGRLGVGLDNIDVAACAARGVAVYPASGANDLAVAEYVITAALVLLRRAWFATGRVTAGEWPRTALMGREIAGKRLGLIGYGSIARVTAGMARGLGMSVAACDPLLPADHPAWATAERQTLPDLLRGSDVVSLHVPLTEMTRNMLDAGALDGVADPADRAERRVEQDVADRAPALGLHAGRRRLVAAAALDLDLHLDLATGRQVRDDVLGIDDLDVVVGLDVGGRDRALAALGELQQHVVAVVELQHDTLQVQEDVDDVLLHAVERRVLVQHAGDADLGRRVAGHRGQQDAAQRVAQRVAVATLERLHHDLRVERRRGLDVDDARFQQSIALHAESLSESQTG